jgi:HlyD family secretion protein
MALTPAPKEVGKSARQARLGSGALVIAPPSPYPRIRKLALAGNLVIATFIVGLGGWSVHAPLASAAVAPGVIESETRRKTIQHLEGGIVRLILVRDGDMVRAGEPLIVMDDTRARTQVAVLRDQLADARAREARLGAERADADRIVFPRELLQRVGRDRSVADLVAGQEAQFESRMETHRARRAVIAERIAQIEEEITGLVAQRDAAEERARIAGEEIATVADLVERGLATRPRLMTLHREQAELDGRRGEIEARIWRARQAIGEARAELMTLDSDRRETATRELHETQTRILALLEEIEAAQDRLVRTAVVAPQDGVVSDLRVHTPGGVVQPGEALLDLVPSDDRLVVEARLRPEDVDVVRVGQKAEVQVTAYKARRAPPLPGTVVHVSADRLVDRRTDQPYYGMRIALDAAALAERADMSLVPGMPVAAFVETGESTVALYALGPLLDTLDRAFRED